MKSMQSEPREPLDAKYVDQHPLYPEKTRVAFDLDGTLCTNELRYTAIAALMGGGNLNGHVTATEITAEMSKHPMYTDSPTPLVDVVRFVHELHLADIWYLTARLDNLRAETEVWLRKHGLPYVGNLIMRPTIDVPAKDLPSNAEYKLEAMQKYDIDWLVEDDPNIIQHLANHGVKVVSAFNYMKVS